jgi:hypothetical protein
VTTPEDATTPEIPRGITPVVLTGTTPVATAVTYDAGTDDQNTSSDETLAYTGADLSTPLLAALLALALGLGLTTATRRRQHQQ